jgi:hypothetical protein
MAKNDPIKNRIKEWQRTIKSIRMGEKWFATLGLNPIDDAIKSPQSGKLIAQAFKEFGLEPQNPSHAEMLCIALADVIFSKRKRGRKFGSIVFDDMQKLTLGLKYEQLLVDDPNISDRRAAKMLLKQGAYGHLITEGAIRQRLPAVRKLLNQVK